MELLKREFGSGTRRVILLHGNSLDERIFFPFINCLKDEFRFITFTLPGHGDSNRLENYEMSRFAELLAENIKIIEGEKHLLAHSLSGHLIFNGLHLLEEVASIICVGSPPLSSLSDTLEAFSDVGHMMYKPKWKPADIKAIVSSLSVSDRHVLIDMLKKVDPSFRHALVSASFMAGFHDEVAILNNTEIPVTLLFSEDDPYLNIQYGKEVNSKIINSKVRIRFLDSGGHVPFLTQPKVFGQYFRNVIYS